MVSFCLSWRCGNWLSPIRLFTLTTISYVVRSIHTPMLLAEVALLLDVSFLGDSGRRLSTRSLVSFLALIGILSCLIVCWTFPVYIRAL